MVEKIYWKMPKNKSFLFIFIEYEFFIKNWASYLRKCPWALLMRIKALKITPKYPIGCPLLSTTTFIWNIFFKKAFFQDITICKLEWETMYNYNTSPLNRIQLYLLRITKLTVSKFVITFDVLNRLYIQLINAYLLLTISSIVNAQIWMQQR